MEPEALEIASKLPKQRSGFANGRQKLLSLMPAQPLLPASP